MLTLRIGAEAQQGHGGSSSAGAADGLEQGRSFDGGGARTAERWRGGAGGRGRRRIGRRAAGGRGVARVAEDARVEAGGGAAGGAGGGGRRGAGAGGADDGERCGKFRQPDGVDLCCAALVLSRKWVEWGRRRGGQF